ncbi:hypothetical protein E1281_20385 [Actinomadura sp. KC345]|uniref:hypothetical protein n=1 Tax=Actinomadura sp. KC345 TaxID=2530371 RepID=UPI00104F2F1C|nr:hypothetical protein [Actinomadura sp. KC345]TDC51545.1 hypothetical protein E1281_20385 [Actinomadura sp. KC345]
MVATESGAPAQGQLVTVRNRQWVVAVVARGTVVSVPATQVAEWSGHSVEVLLRVYAKCIEGQDEAAKRRNEQALRA